MQHDWSSDGPVSHVETGSKCIKARSMNIIIDPRRQRCTLIGTWY